MVCKEEIVSWFKESVCYKRVDLMCTLLNMCLPFELRFLGTCLEELGKRDFTELREAEMRANNASEFSDSECVSEQHTRRKLALYLALLHSANHGCSNVLYNILKKFNLAEVQSVLNNPNLASSEGENLLDELLTLYTIALNHPAFTYEQKSELSNIFVSLQEEENKVSYSHKPTLMCMKPGPIYVPYAASPDVSMGGVNQQYSTALKPILVPSVGMGNAGEAGKAMPFTEVSNHTAFFQLSHPNAGGPQGPNSVLLYFPPPALAHTVTTARNATADYTTCPPAQFSMPSIGGKMPCASGMVPGGANVTNTCLPSASNPEFTSPTRSPCGSPCGSPIASRSGSPGCLQAAGQSGGGACYHPGGPQEPPRHGSCSSSSSSCSGGSTGGYRSSRGSRVKYNGPVSVEMPPPHLEQPRLVGEGELGAMLATMNLANGVCSGQEPRQRFREDKRHWVPNPNVPPPVNQNSGSAGSSQSESPSPPRSPPQDEQWECKEDGARWDKMPPIPDHQFQGHVPPRTIVDPAAMRRHQEMKHGVYQSRRPTAAAGMAAMPLVFSSNAQMQPLRASTGAIFPGNPAFMTGTSVFATMMPQPASGPASFPPFTPNGITSPPPEIVYGVPPSQTSPPPFPVQQPPQSQTPQQPPPPPQPFPTTKQTSSPPPQYLLHTPSYPPPAIVTNTKLTCYNCGGANHSGTECREPSIEEIMRRGQYRIDFASPQSSIESPPIVPTQPPGPPGNKSLSNNTGGGGASMQK